MIMQISRTNVNNIWPSFHDYRRACDCHLISFSRPGRIPGRFFCQTDITSTQVDQDLAAKVAKKMEKRVSSITTGILPLPDVMQGS
jgi:hypothetical protein